MRDRKKRFLWMLLTGYKGDGEINSGMASLPEAMPLGIKVLNFVAWHKN